MNIKQMFSHYKRNSTIFWGLARGCRICYIELLLYCYNAIYDEDHV
jgi:hypothetical protein